MTRILHLAQGDSAAGNIRGACTSHGMPGRVFAIPDDLSHGPLDDGQSRIAHLQNCFQGYDGSPIELIDAFAAWERLTATIGNTETDTVVVWAGDNVSEATFLNMACWRFFDEPLRILHANVRAYADQHYVAAQPPEALAEHFPSARALSAAERTDHAKGFRRLRDEKGLLRRWAAGRVVSVSADTHDHLLLSCCDNDWQPATRVVGGAMGQCDGHNLMSDLFFTWRLHRLVEKGLVETRGSADRLRTFSVRLAET